MRTGVNAIPLRFGVRGWNATLEVHPYFLFPPNTRTRGHFSRVHPMLYGCMNVWVLYIFYGCDMEYVVQSTPYGVSHHVI